MRSCSVWRRAVSQLWKAGSISSKPTPATSRPPAAAASAARAPRPLRASRSAVIHIDAERARPQPHRGSGADQRAAARRKHHLARLVDGLAQGAPGVRPRSTRSTAFPQAAPAAPRLARLSAEERQHRATPCGYAGQCFGRRKLNPAPPNSEMIRRGCSACPPCSRRAVSRPGRKRRSLRRPFGAHSGATIIGSRPDADAAARSRGPVARGHALPRGPDTACAPPARQPPRRVRSITQGDRPNCLELPPDHAERDPARYPMKAGHRPASGERPDAARASS